MMMGKCVPNMAAEGFTQMQIENIYYKNCTIARGAAAPIALGGQSPV
jgi:hypothetical protein